MGACEFANYFYRCGGGTREGRMVDALALKGDEGRGVPAIRFGEVANNL